jgi:hypothetical protein
VSQSGQNTKSKILSLSGEDKQQDGMPIKGRGGHRKKKKRKGGRERTNETKKKRNKKHYRDVCDNNNNNYCSLNYIDAIHFHPFLFIIIIENSCKS